jgi:hypothetical protein
MIEITHRRSRSTGELTIRWTSEAVTPIDLRYTRAACWPNDLRIANAL